MPGIERACRECHHITNEDACPKCKSTNLSKDIIGFVHVVDFKGSYIAKKMGVDANGKWALKVR